MNDEQAEEWWKATDDQNGLGSVQWTNANNQTFWEPEGPVGGIEMNSIETKYIEQDELGQKWLRLNYDSGAAVTALLIAIAGDFPLEKCGEFRVAPGATIPNSGKIKMKSTDESGMERTLRGNITKVSKPLLSAAEVSSKMEESCWNEVQAQCLESWEEHQAPPRGQLVQCTCANWRCHTGACTSRTSRGELDQDGS